MDKTEYINIEERLGRIFDRYADQLSIEGRENVAHFIENAEIEMACESFVLSLVEEKIQLPEQIKKELLGLSLTLGLDKNSVFRADFWGIINSAFDGGGHQA